MKVMVIRRPREGFQKVNRPVMKLATLLLFIRTPSLSGVSV